VVVTNKHLNVFEFYQNEKTIPIENNISRGLAIVLRAYPLFLDRFLDLLNQQLQNRLQKANSFEEIDVQIQLSADRIANEYEGVSRIVGISLSADYVQNLGEWHADNPIPDIAIKINDALLVIEVKTNNVDPSKELKNQVEQIRAKLGLEASSVESVSCDWAVILLLLQQTRNLLCESDSSILSQYLEHLTYRFPEWFPVQNITASMIDSDDVVAINKRIGQVAQRCAELFSGGAAEKWGGHTFDIFEKYAHCGGARLSFDSEQKALVVTLWPGDTKGQGKILFDVCNKTYDWIENSSDGSLTTTPYIRFADSYGSTKAYIDLPPNVPKLSWYEFWKKVSGKWKEESYAKLKEAILECYKDARFVDFEREFVNSNRTAVLVSLGFRIEKRIRADAIVQFDRSTPNSNGVYDGAKDSLANAIVQGMISRLNKIGSVPR
jgi:hypothetical protein